MAPDKRRLSNKAIVGIVLVAIVLAGGLAFALSHRKAPDSSIDVTGSSEAPSAPAPGDSSAAAATLPFTLEGVPAEGTLIDATDSADRASVSSGWTFGGDYSLIGSFPLSSDAVFGSETDDPSDVEGYHAALISPDGVTPIEQAQSGDKFFEPQDGSGNANQIVWRSAELTNLPSNGTDNWRVQAWSKDRGAAVVLGSAEKENGTDRTPVLDAEIVPSANDHDAFFASMTKAEDGWKPTVMSWAVDGSSEDTVYIGYGSYPAAVADGCLWASDPSYVDPGTFYGSLSHWNGSTSEKVFSIDSTEGTWSVSGVWAFEGNRVIGFSSDDGSRGSYIGVWQDDFGKFCGWVHVASPRVIGCLNASWFVWGAGSESDNSGMYALRLSDCSLYSLGSCAGYSRPSLARDSDAVLIPVANGLNAVSYQVVVLQ